MEQSGQHIYGGINPIQKSRYKPRYFDTGKFNVISPNLGTPIEYTNANYHAGPSMMPLHQKNNEEEEKKDNTIHPDDNNKNQPSPGEPASQKNSKKPFYPATRRYGAETPQKSITDSLMESVKSYMLLFLAMTGSSSSSSSSSSSGKNAFFITVVIMVVLFIIGLLTFTGYKIITNSPSMQGFI